MILSNPSSIFAFIGLLILILAIIYVKRVKFTTKMLINSAMLIGLALVLHYFMVIHLPQGGSVNLSMIPLLLIVYAYGLPVGLLTGFVFGITICIIKPYIVHPVQVLFDYPLPYMALALAGLFKSPVIGAVFGIFNRFLCHVISGVVFFASYAPAGTSPLVYSLTYNATYMLPGLILTVAVITILPIKKLVFMMQNK